jgi:hypothetical protein
VARGRAERRAGGRRVRSSGGTGRRRHAPAPGEGARACRQRRTPTCAACARCSATRPWCRPAPAVRPPPREERSPCLGEGDEGWSVGTSGLWRFERGPRSRPTAKQPSSCRSRLREKWQRHQTRVRPASERAGVRVEADKQSTDQSRPATPQARDVFRVSERADMAGRWHQLRAERLSSDCAWFTLSLRTPSKHLAETRRRAKGCWTWSAKG